MTVVRAESDAGDDAIVIQIDTEGVVPGQLIRVNLNDGVVFDGDAERDESGPQTVDAIAAIIADESSADGADGDVARYARIVELVHTATRQRDRS